MNITRLLVLVPCLFLILSSGASARQPVIYDRTDGFAETQPFVEHLQIKLKSFSDSLKLLRMVFKELDRKPKKDGTTPNYDSDNAYFASLPEFMNFSFDNNGIGIVYRQLEPNKYYYVELQCKQQQPLSKAERDALMQKLQQDESIKRDFLLSLKTAGFGSKNIDILNAIIYKKIKAVNQDYEISGIAKPLGNAAIEKAFRDIESNSAEMGQAMRNLLDFVNDRDALKAYAGAVEQLYIAVRFPNSDEDVYLPAVTGTFSDYRQNVNALYDKIFKAMPDSADSQAKQDLGNNKDDLNTGLDNVKVQIDQWISLVDSLISVTVDHVYISRLLVSTKPDESLVEGTANKLNASISQTFGWGLSPKTSSGFLYVGYSLFFRAVNPGVPFRNIPSRDRWKAMVGANLGFTLTDMTTNNYGKAAGIVSFLGDKALMVGLCFRPYHFIKLDFNGLLYTLNDPNPLNNHRRLAFAPLIGISLSLNVVKLFNGQPNSFTTLSENLKK
jgi:hypothetical protein